MLKLEGQTEINAKTKKASKKADFVQSAFRLVCVALLIALPGLSLLSCSGGEVRPDKVMLENSKSGNPKITNYNLGIAARAVHDATYGSADYKIGPEDLLEISIFQVKEMTSTVRVSGNGYIGLPLAGRIKASGHTVSGLEDVIAKKLDRYLQHPTVSVFIKEYRSQPISVVGAVKTPKVYYAKGMTRLLDVLSMAGGLTPTAGNVCIVEQVSRDGKCQHKSVIDLDHLLAKGDARLDIPLEAGDIVDVPEGGVFFIDGGVKAPGSYSIKGTTTLTQAVTMAKGFLFEAEKNDIKIYRDDGRPRRKVIRVKYSQIIDGKRPDIVLKDKDIIVVPRNGFKAVLKGISTSLTFGAFNVGKYSFY